MKKPLASRLSRSPVTVPGRLETDCVSPPPGKREGELPRFRTPVWEHQITTGELCARLGLDFIDYYIDRRRLGWLGHVSRMDFDRLPRRMLSSWVPHGRPIGCPNMTFGRSIRTALDKFHIDRSRWPELAADRSAWRQTLEDRRPPDAFFAMPATARPPSPRIAHTKPVRACAARTNAAMDISLQALAWP